MFSNFWTLLAHLFSVEVLCDSKLATTLVVLCDSELETILVLELFPPAMELFVEELMTSPAAVEAKFTLGIDKKLLVLDGDSFVC